MNLSQRIASTRICRIYTTRLTNGGYHNETKITEAFSLTDKGIDNMMRASVSSFFKYVTFMLPPMIVFIFLNDMINSNLKPIAHYIGIIVIIAILMYLANS